MRGTGRLAAQLVVGARQQNALVAGAPGRDAQLAGEPGDRDLDGLPRDDALGGDLLIREALRHEAQRLELDVRERNMVGSFTMNGQKETMWDWYPTALDVRRRTSLAKK